LPPSIFVQWIWTGTSKIKDPAQSVSGESCSLFPRWNLVTTSLERYDLGLMDKRGQHPLRIPLKGTNPFMKDVHLSPFFLIYFWYAEIGSCFIIKHASNLQSSCLSLPNTGITDVRHPSQHYLLILLNLEAKFHQVRAQATPTHSLVSSSTQGMNVEQPGSWKKNQRLVQS
jgi:hypothetical protein